MVVAKIIYLRWKCGVTEIDRPKSEKIIKTVEVIEIFNKIEE